MEEQQAIEKVKQGNANAFSFLVNKYQDVVYSIALKVLKNRGDAEEMAQEVFIKAFRSIQSYQGKSKFSTWLYSITYNTCITHVRKKKMPVASVENLSEEDQETEGGEEDFREEQAKYLETALKLLPEEEYLLIVLHYYEDQGIQDICEVTGLSESNVKVRLHRTRKKLYAIMNDLMKKEIFLPL